jgi:hypothetical protein
MVVMLRRRQRWFSFLFPTTVVVLLLLARALVWCLSEAVLFPVSGDGGGFVLLRVFCFGVRRRWLCFWRRYSCSIGFCSYCRIPDLYVAAGWFLVVGGKELVAFGFG